MIDALKKIIGLKTCTCCKKTKSLKEFQNITSRNAYVSQCKNYINTKRLARARLKGVKPRQQITDLKRGVKIDLRKSSYHLQILISRRGCK